jgi:transposase, IS5 family
MHEPSDSSLLWDAVRIMVRLLKRADALVGDPGLPWRDHCRAAKKRARQIQFTRGRPNRIQLYRELIAITRATLAYLKQATERLAVASTPVIALWQVEVHHYQPLVERIVRQERAAGVGRRDCAGQ